ncbi:MAG: hypothetical protein JST01_02810 [Cyanobacteria bacterium SZAS TMP-1]|nr:hypothetical protein [Cyanobacteria bacterium SZAS TMP-1]
MKVTYLLLVLAIAALPVCRADDASAQPPLVLSVNHTDHPYERIESLFTSLQTDSDLSLAPDQFAAALGDDAADCLKLLQVQLISVHQGQVLVELSRSLNTTTKKGTKIRVAGRISFTLKREPDGRLLVTEISGIQVRSFWLGFIGWMQLERLSVGVNTANHDNTDITAELKTSIGRISRAGQLDQDGKPVK